MLTFHHPGWVVTLRVQITARNIRVPTWYFSDVRGPLPWNATAADAVAAAVGALEQVGPAAALSLSGAVQGLAEGLQPRDRRL